MPSNREKPSFKVRDDFVLTFRDLSNIAKKNRKTIWIFSGFCALLTLFFVLISPIEYQAEGTFKDKGKSQSGMNQSLTAILLSGEINESNVLALMQSRRLVEEIVRSLGLQAVITKSERVFPLLPLNVIRDNFFAEYASLANKNFPVLDQNQNNLVGEDIDYLGEVPLALIVIFHTADQFEVLSKGSEMIGKGSLGEPFITKAFQMTLKSQGSPSFAGLKYNLILYPLGKTAEKIAKKFKIETDRNDKNLLRITYRNQNRHHAVHHLNALMAAYQNYISEEHKRLNNIQIDYLEERQHEIARQLEEMIRNYADNLSLNLSSMGVATYDIAMEFLTSNQQNFMQKNLAIDLETQWLIQAQQEGKKNYDKFNSSITPEAVNALSREIRSLRQKADTLDLALRNTPLDWQQFQSSLDQQLKELNNIKQYSEEAKFMLINLEKDEMPQKPQGLFNSQEFMVRIWYERLHNEHQARSEMAGEWLNCKYNCMSYLSHLVHYLDVRRRSIEERLGNQQLPLDEFQGIDLNTARQLYVTYSKELNVLESNAAQQQFLISQINHPDFEISSLSTVMNDPISIEMISKASKQIISLRDYENRTQKEQERIKASLAIYKEFFTTHIGQELQLIDLRQQILKEKIKALQSTNLALIQERISILENQMAEYLAKRLTSLKRERVLYEELLKDFRKEMALLPHKWVNEKLITQQMEINQSMVEEISKLVESKNITNNLETIQSTPIDLPLLPLNPRPPHLLLFTLIGAVAGAFLGLAWVLGKSIAEGVEAAEDNLRFAGQYVAGRLSKDLLSQPGLPLLDRELDTLRRLIAFMEIGPLNSVHELSSCRGQTLLLLIGKGPNYAPTLADLISKMGLKTIIINACFDQKESHQLELGMLQYLEGKTEQPTIISQQSYDIIPAGGLTRHATELMATRRFSALLESLKNRYDWTLVCSKANVLSAEAESLVDRFPNAAVSLDGEPLDKLGAYIQGASQYGDSQRHIAYIFLDQKTGNTRQSKTCPLSSQFLD